jgi:hypothetical protein
MVTLIRTLLFGLAAYLAAGWLTVELGPGGSGRFGSADAWTKAWLINGPIAGLFGLLLGFFFPYPRPYRPRDEPGAPPPD